MDKIKYLLVFVLIYLILREVYSIYFQNKEKYEIENLETDIVEHLDAPAPNTIGGLQFWFDGKDPSNNGSTPGANTAITTWVDKSGNGRNATQTAGTNTAKFVSGGGLVFSSSQLTITNPPTISNGTWFFVLSPSSNKQAYLYWSDNNGELLVNWDMGAFALWNPNASAFLPSSSTPPQINLLDWTAVQKGANIGYYNGSQAFSDTADFRYYYQYNGIKIYNLGGISANWYIGTIYEVIAYNSVLSTTDRQNVEGYLANKWGIAKSLPTSHPYYPKPVTVNVTGPSSLTMGQYFEAKATGTWSDASGAVWALNGVQNSGCRNPGCGFYAPNTPGNAIITYTVQGVTGTLTIPVTGVPLKTYALSGESGAIAGAGIGNGSCKINGVAIWTDNTTVIVYGQDGGTVRCVDGTGAAKYYTGSVNDFATAYYGAIAASGYTFVSIQNQVNGIMYGNSIGGTPAILGSIVVNNTVLYYTANDNFIKIVDQNLNVAYYSGTAVDYGKIVWYYMSMKTAGNGSYKYTLFSETYYIGPYAYNKEQAQAKCALYGGTLANYNTILAAQLLGAQWCAAGRIADGIIGTWPMQEGAPGCGGPGVSAWSPDGNIIGIACFGIKPASYVDSNIDPWSQRYVDGKSTQRIWNQAYVDTTSLGYDPSKGKFILFSASIDQTINTNGYKGRYVRLRPAVYTGDGWFHISQVIVTDASGRNVARDKPVYVTSMSDGSGLGKIIVDGTTTARAWPNIWHARNPGQNEFAEIDLGFEIAISSIRFLGRSGCCENRILQARIEINSTSDAGVTTYYKTIGDDPQNGKFDLPSNCTTVDNTVKTNGFSGRYIRVKPSVNTGDGFLVLSQIIVNDASGKNLALGKATFASSTYAQGTYPATLLTDGNTTQRAWPLVWCASTPNRNTEFVEVDLGGTFAIDNVRLISQPGYASGNSIDRTSEILFEINSSSTANYTEYSKIFGLDPGSGKFILPNGNLDQTIQLNGFTGRYVRIRPSIYYGNGSLHMSGIIVTNAAGVNVALGKPVYVTSSLGGGGIGQILVDGNSTARRWPGIWHANTENRNTEFAEIDLGSPIAISSIRYLGRADCCYPGINGGGDPDRITHTRFEISYNTTDANVLAWHKSIGNDTSNGKFISSSTYPQTDTTITTNGFSGRYIRIRPSLNADGDGLLQIGQIVVNDSTGKNVALGKGVYTTSTYTGFAPGSVTVDGTLTVRTNMEVWEPLTANRAEEFIEIDLGSSIAVSSIRITGRTDCCFGRMSQMRAEINASTTPSVLAFFNYVIDGLAGKEVYQFADQNYTADQAVALCTQYGGTLASVDQLRAAQQAGAAWCSWGWVSDSNNGVIAFPMQEVFPVGDPKFGYCNSTGVNSTPNKSTTDKRAVNCYGIKPPKLSANIQPFYASPLSPPAKPTKYNSPTVAKYMGNDPKNGKFLIPGSGLDQTIQTNGFTGRYIRIRPSVYIGDGWLHLSQLIVKDSNGNNVALRRPVYVNSILNGSGISQIIVDGATTARSGPGIWHAATNNRATEFAEIDLGSSIGISSIQYLGRSDCCYSGSTTYDVDRISETRIEINTTTTVPTTTALTNLVATINPIGFTVSWTGANNAAAFNYILVSGSTTSIVVPDSIGTNSATFTTNILPGTTYTISVTPYTNTGASVTFTTAPSPVQNLSSTTTKTGIIINWVPNLSATGYIFKINGNIVTPTSSNITYGPRAYSSTAGVDYPGQGDISSQSGVSGASVCQKLCDSAIGCTGNVIRDGTCYLKNFSLSILSSATTVCPTCTLYLATPVSATFSGLSPNSAYIVTVIPTVTVNTPNNDNQSSGTGTSVSPVTLPSDIVLTQSSLATNGFVLTWPINTANTTSVTTTTYTYAYNTTSLTSAYTNITNGFNTTGSTATQMFANFTSLNGAITPGSTYFMQVTPINNNGAGVGTPSKIAITTPPTPLSNSSITKGTVISTTASFSWTASTGATNYSYTIGVPTATLSTLSSISLSGTNTTVSNLSPGTTYQFTLTPLCNNVSNTPGSMVFTTLPASMSSIPTSSSLTASSISLTWSACAGATGYNFTISPQPTTLPTMPVNNSTVTFTGLNPGSTYTIKIIPINTSSGSALASSFDTIAVTTQPAPITGLVINSYTITGFSIQWPNDTSANGFICTNSKTSTIIPTKSTPLTTVDSSPVVTISSTSTTTTALFSGCNAGTSYSITITPLQGNVQGTPSSPQVALTLPPAVTIASILNSSNPSTSFTVDWTTNPSLGASGYNYQITPEPPSGASVNSTGSITSNILTCTNMSPTTLYTIVITPTNANGSGPFTQSTITTAPAPSTPTITVYDETTATVTFTNGSVPSGTSYKYTYSTGSASTPPSTSNYSTVTTAFVNLTGLTNNTLYTVYIYPIFNGVSGILSTCTFTTLAKTISSITASAITTTGFTASWSSSPNATYSYYTVQNTTQSATLTTTTTSVTLTNLQPGTSYDFYVSPVNSANTLGHSTHLSTPLVTLPNPISTAPVVSLATASSFTLTWNSALGAANYIYTISPQPVMTSTVILPQNPMLSSRTSTVVANFSGLMAGSTYTIIITPQNSVNNRAVSTTTVLAKTLPAAVTGVSAPPALVSASGFTINWPVDVSATSFSYTLNSKSISLNLVNTTTTSTITTAVFTGLNSGTVYTVGITPISDGGNGEVTTIIVTTLPAKINSLIIQPGSLTPNGFTVNWNQITGANGYTYTITPAPPGVTSISPIRLAATTVTLTGLLPATLYTVNVCAINSAGSSMYSNIKQTTMPGTLSGIIATSISTTGFTVAWADMANTTYNYVITYPDNTVYSDKTNLSSLTLSKLQPNTAYGITVTPINTLGISGPSSNILVETIPKEVGSLGFISNSITTSSATISWSGTPSVNNYIYTISPTLSPKTFQTDTTNANLTNLSAGTTYTIDVIPMNSTGGKGITSSLSVTTQTNPVILSSSTLTSNGFTVSWIGVRGAIRYSYTLTSPALQNPIKNSTAALSVTFSTLLPGVEYNIEVVAVNANNFASNSTSLLVTTLPPPITELRSIAVTSNSFNLQWPNDVGATSFTYLVNNTIPVIPVTTSSDDTKTTAVFLGLKSSSTYIVSVTPVDVSGAGKPTTISVNTLPDQINGIVSSAIKTTSFTISWPNTNATTYNYTLNGISTIPANSSKNASFTTTVFSGLTAGTLYNVAVIPINNGTQGSSTSAKVTTVPDAVTGVEISLLTSSGYSVSWTASPGATNYTCTNNSTIQFISSKTTSFSNLSPGKTYTLTIIPSNAGGSGTPTTVSVTTLPTSSSPVATSITSSSCTITWPAVINASSYNYTITPSISNTVNTTVAKSVNFTGLKPGTTYTFSLTSVNNGGSSTPTTTSFITLPNAIISETIQTGTITDTEISLTWPISIGATGYIYSTAVKDSDSTVSNSVTTNKCTISNLSAGQIYTITVTPTISNISGIPGIISVPTGPGAITSTPTVSSITTTGFTVKWLASSGATSYNYTINPLPSVALTSTSTPTTSVTFNNLTAGKLYTVTISPSNSSVTLPPTTITTATLPIPIIGLGSKNITNSGFTLTWPLDESATSFNYNINGSPTSIVTTSSTDTITTAEFTGLLPGLNYSVDVIPVDSSGVGASTNINVLTLPETILALSLQPGSNTPSGFIINWPAITSATSYTYSITPQITTPPAQPKSPTLNFTDLDPGTTYTITVAPINKSGSGSSTSINVTTLPSQITNLTPVNVLANSFSVVWNAGKGNASFVYFITDPTTNINSIKLKTTTSNFISFTNLTVGVLYSVTIIPVNSNNDSGTPTSIMVETLPSSSDPSSMVANSITKTSFILGWTSGGSTNNYQCTVTPNINCPVTYLSPSNSFISPSASIIVPAMNSKNFTGLLPGTQYTVTLSPINSTNGTSTGVTLAVTTLPPPVTLTMAQLASTSFQLSWVSIPSAINYLYTIKSSDGSLSNVNSTTSTTINFTGLNSNVTYNISVSPISNNNLQGDISSLLVTTLPSPITSLTSSLVTTTGFTLQWPNDISATSYTYNINGNLATPVTEIVGSVTTTAVFNNLSGGTTYTISVTPINSSGNGEVSSVIVTTLPDQITALNLKSGTLTSKGFTIEWPQDLSATSFTFSLNQATVTPDSQSLTTAVFSKLLPGTQYTVEVTPISAGGAGTPAIINISTLPDAISSVALVPNSLTDTTFSLSWPIEPSASNYKYSPINPISGNTTSTTTTAVFANLTPGTLYNMKITPVDEGGDGAPTNFTVTTLPSKITSLALVPKSTTINSFKLQWTTNSSATNYIFTLNGVTSTPTVDTTTSTTTAFFNSLNSNTLYNVIITPTNSGGSGTTATITVPTLIDVSAINSSPSGSNVSASQQLLTTQTNNILKNLANTTSPTVISNALSDLSSTLQSQNTSSSIPITNPETVKAIYSYYASTNPTLDTTLPLVSVTTTQDTDGNQIIDPASLPISTSTSTNIIIPLDPGKSVTMNSVVISRGSLSDGTNANQSNQIQINGGKWLNYNQSVTVGNNIFLFVGSGSPIIMQILPISTSPSSSSSSSSSQALTAQTSLILKNISTSSTPNDVSTALTTLTSSLQSQTDSTTVPIINPTTVNTIYSSYSPTNPTLDTNLPLAVAATTLGNNGNQTINSSTLPNTSSNILIPLEAGASINIDSSVITKNTTNQIKVNNGPWLNPGQSITIGNKTFTYVAEGNPLIMQVTPSTVSSSTASAEQKTMIAQANQLLEKIPISSTTNPAAVTVALVALSSSLKSQTISTAIPISTPKLVSTIYSSYSPTNPILDTTLPLAVASTIKGSNGNQTLDPSTLPTTGSTNILIPLDPGGSINIGSSVVKKGILSNQIQVDNGPWLNPGESVIIGNYTYTYVASSTPGTPVIMQVTPLPTPSSSSAQQELMTKTSKLLQNLKSTSTSAEITSALNYIAATLQGQNISNLVTITAPETVKALYSYYSSINPNIDSTLPLTMMSTSFDSVGNQIINTKNLPKNKSNVLIPLDPGNSVNLGTNTITRGSLTDRSGENQTNQVTVNSGEWLDYGETITFGKYSFLFVGSGSPIVMQVTQIPTPSVSPNTSGSFDILSIINLFFTNPNNLPVIIGGSVAIILIIIYMISSRKSRDDYDYGDYDFNKYGE